MLSAPGSAPRAAVRSLSLRSISWPTPERPPAGTTVPNPGRRPKRRKGGSPGKPEKGSSPKRYGLHDRIHRSKGVRRSTGPEREHRSPGTGSPSGVCRVRRTPERYLAEPTPCGTHLTETSSHPWAARPPECPRPHLPVAAAASRHSPGAAPVRGEEWGMLKIIKIRPRCFFGFAPNSVEVDPEFSLYWRTHCRMPVRHESEETPKSQDKKSLDSPPTARVSSLQLFPFFTTSCHRLPPR